MGFKRRNLWLFNVFETMLTWFQIKVILYNLLTEWTIESSVSVSAKFKIYKPIRLHITPIKRYITKHWNFLFRKWLHRDGVSSLFPKTSRIDDIVISTCNKYSKEHFSGVHRYFYLRIVLEVLCAKFLTFLLCRIYEDTILIIHN